MVIGGGRVVGLCQGVLCRRLELHVVIEAA